MFERVFPADTSYEEGEAEYDAAEYNYQIVDDSDDVLVLCGDKRLRDHILELLKNNPLLG